MKFEFREEGADGAVASRSQLPDNSLRRLEFDLPNKLLAQLVGCGAAYLAAMYVAFRQASGLGLIFVVFGLVLVAYYGLPLLMQRTSGRQQADRARRGAWGIDTASGYLSGRAAYAQVMTVPLLMVAWAIIMATMM
jgi:hypothetical protein